MNQKAVVVASERDEGPEADAPALDVNDVIAIARRQWQVFAIILAAFLLMGAGYLLTAVPRYTARTSVLIDRVNSQVVEQLSTVGGVLDDESSFLSQVELLKSEAVGLSAVDMLRLQDDPEFMRGSGSPILSVLALALSPKRWFDAGADLSVDSAEARRRTALTRLLDGMDVARVGRSYVIDVSFTATSPQLAASIAGGIAEAYLTDKLDAKYDATRRAGEWLLQRIDDLRRRSLESDLAVQRFRAANGLLVADEKLVSDQQLTELNSALIVARADTARAQARYERIQAIIGSGQSDAIVTDALDNSVINTLRERYLEASKRESEIGARLGAGHVRVIRLRQEMSEYRRLMFDELKRIAGSYQSELDVAQSRERRITEGVVGATAVSVSAGETQVQLRELVRSAETYRNLYQTFLQRYHEAVQQQSFPVTEARLISRAVPPVTPSEPRIALVLAVSVVLGSAFGGAAVAFREFRDRFFRTGEQVRDVLGLEYLGAVPLVKPIDDDLAGPGAIKGEISRRSPVFRFASDHPFSPFAETLRSIKLAADLHIDKPRRIIGIVSMLPGEGKSTIAANFAQTLAKGARTLLIDGDLRNPGATRALAYHADEGLLEVLLEDRPLASVTLADRHSGLNFLAAVIKRRVPHSSELLSSRPMTELLVQASGDFEYVVLDLPPLGPVVDARAVAPRLDGFVLVVEWGQTPRKLVRDMLAAEPHVMGRCLGVVLNKVDSGKMKLYREYGSPQYYASRYTSYYHDEAS